MASTLCIHNAHSKSRIDLLSGKVFISCSPKHPKNSCPPSEHLYEALAVQPRSLHLQPLETRPAVHRGYLSLLSSIPTSLRSSLSYSLEAIPPPASVHVTNSFSSAPAPAHLPCSVFPVVQCLHCLQHLPLFISGKYLHYSRRRDGCSLVA